MNHRTASRSVLIIVLLLLLSACARSAAITEQKSVGAPASSAPASSTQDHPTRTQAMICGDDVKGDIQTALGLSAPPAVTPAYTGSLFSCTYHLAQGPMTLSVQHSATDADAVAYITATSASSGASTTLAGLSTMAFGSGTGIVFTVKDNETLKVDTTRLPMVFGSQNQNRVDFAYEVASIVLGCWTGHDS